MQVDVVRHDDSAYDSHSLLQLQGATAVTVWYEHPFQQLPLVWLYHYILQQQRVKVVTVQKKNYC